MPNPKGWAGDPLHRCDNCKREYRLSQLQWQEGHLRCVAHCVDNLLIKTRDSIITNKLSFSSEEGAPAEKLRRPSNLDDLQRF